MTINCTKCGGLGYIKQFGAVENGVCFRCAGEGIEMTAAERKAANARRTAAAIEALDRRLAKQSGMTLDQFRAYVSWSYYFPTETMPKDERGYTLGQAEFAKWFGDRKVGA